MINTDELKIVNYCHPKCEPFMNILRIPKDEAFALAYKMSAENPETTAFYRFADFENYYPRRIKQDAELYSQFKTLGGNPQESHPLSFVLQGSDYLYDWFGKGTVYEMFLKNIPAEYISFTYGDSGAVFNKTGFISVITKDKLLESIRSFNGTLDEYMKEMTKKHYYIEVQLWNDEYIKNFRSNI